MSTPQAAPQLNLVPTRELAQLLVKLGQSKDFERLMEILTSRRDGLGVWAHTIPTEPYKTWASGRVQELAELVALYDGRHQGLAAFNAVDIRRPPTFGGDE